ncbi:hypothetical protein QBC46DRAFT_394618 [Diplogelasinospora grovesii]|uniref:DnaJ homologue subfamily C member 28 conserved domain-containing protein n=1 Tax=Diplogelasinospora grovesii TaxID=303347 RepID=A0AAN6N2G3_9PEZI|nr:hypothetical protein QBC46DRAFT_394618 [Diplogelasinospora grovesii]
MSSAPFVCARCTRALRARRSQTLPPLRPSRAFSQTPTPLSAGADQATHKSDDANTTSSPDLSQPPDPPREEKEQGALSRRLEAATEEALLSGGRAGRRSVLEDAGFSEELKSKLLNKLADAQFRNDNISAFSEAGISSKIPEAAGQGTRSTASAQPWTGEESTQDAVLRMLTDAQKPLAPGLRGKAKIPTPQPVDMRFQRDPAMSAGQRAASARDKAATYASMGIKGSEVGLSQEEREAMRREFRDRFRPEARAMPNTISGLAALANERIEDAIARGQFKNIPRGKGVERDTRADNPFVDTTEYIMNKMIKRQEIVPPWIEKQQELLKAANVFRARLRSDWKRHAARMISSRGGSLQDQLHRAAEYAKAEEVHNPRRRNVDQISVPTNSTEDVVIVRMRQQASSSGNQDNGDGGGAAAPQQATLTRPFRDPEWEATERSYMELAITNLNAITRSYNLMAPELAKKPYFSLERELNSCFADVAPLLADAIKERATRPPKSLLDSGPGGQGRRSSNGLLDRFGKSTARVYDNKAPHYGFKEMWRDLWSRPSQ